MTASTAEGRQAYAILTWVNDDAASRVASGVERVDELARKAGQDTRALREVQGVGLVLARLADALGSPAAALSNGDGAQVIDLHSFFNPLEPRGDHGEWVKSMDAAVRSGATVLSRDDLSEHAALAFGNPATARHVITVIPGVGTAEDVPAGVQWARTLKTEADNRLNGSTAVVYWHGYKPPAYVGGALSDKDASGASGALADFQAALRKANPDASQTVVGHSYGTAVAAHAAKDHGMKADNLVLLGSPGVPARKASELGPDGHVFAAYNSGDPVQKIATLRHANPVSKSFGARIINAELPATENGRGIHGTAAHLSYRSPDNAVNTDIARIATGVQQPFWTKQPEPTDEQEAMTDLRNAGMWSPALRAAGFSGGIAGQFLELSWKDAYKTELRDPHGRFASRGGTTARAAIAADKRHASAHQASIKRMQAVQAARHPAPAGVPGQGERSAPARDIGSITDKIRQDLGKGGIAQQAVGPPGYVKQEEFNSLVSKLQKEADDTAKKAKDTEHDLREEHRADLFVEIGAIAAGVALAVFTGGISLALTTLLPFVARTLIVDKSPEIAQALARYHIVGKGHGRAWLAHPVAKTHYTAQAVAREVPPKVAALRQSASQRVQPAMRALRQARPKPPPTPPRPLSAGLPISSSRTA